MTAPQKPSALRRFFLPKLNRAFFFRFLLVTLIALTFFSKFCLPARVNGKSMEPTYHTGDFIFCWTPAYRNQSPQLGDLVIIKYVKKKIMYLKRVIATEGQTVEFRKGKLYVDDQPIEEPWTDTSSCDWDMPPVKVKENCVYVVGDNRKMPIEEHRHGEVYLIDIAGKPL